MTNVYTGKTSTNGKSIAICKVIDCDIVTGNAIVYNRESGKIEVLLYREKIRLDENVRRLANDTEHEYTKKIKKAFSKFHI